MLFYLKKVKILPREAECNLLWISGRVCKDLPEVLADSRSPKQISLLETFQEPEIKTNTVGIQILEKSAFHIIVCCRKLNNVCTVGI